MPTGTAPLHRALDQLAKKGNFKFSYSPDHLPADSLVTLGNMRMTVRQHLDRWIKRGFDAKENGHFVILQPKPTGKKDLLQLQGRVVDGRNRQAISNATVYDPLHLHSTNTDHNGNYMLQVPQRGGYIPLAISKVNYRDTIIMLPVGKQTHQTVAIIPKPLEKVASVDVKKLENRQEIDYLPTVKLWVPPGQMEKTKNLGETIRRTAQVSLVPTIGSNRRLSGVVSNGLSLNILAGYSGEIHGVEVGGLTNIVKHHVSGLEIAGLGNLVGGNLQGTQIAGLANHVGGDIYGMQVSGLYNLGLKDLHGMQVSGLINAVGGQIKGTQLAGFANYGPVGVSGFQVSGLVNLSGGPVGMGQASGFANISLDDVGGCQFSGFVNVTEGHVSGLQAAGFANVALGNVGGVQVSGFGNLCTDTVKGLQLSGAFNQTKVAVKGQLSGLLNIATAEASGVQISGFLNVAKSLKGVQIGIFNVSKEAQGTPIGLFSYVHRGHTTMGLWANEVLPVGLKFTTGVERFYNVFTIGLSPIKEQWGYGYGIGSSRRFGEKKRLGHQAEMLLWKVHPQYGLDIFELNFLARLHYGVSWRKGRVSVLAGPSVTAQTLASQWSEKVYAPYDYKRVEMGWLDLARWYGGDVTLVVHLGGI